MSSLHAESAADVDRMGLDRLPWDIVDRRLSDLVSLAGRGAVVTGGGGASLGQAIAHRLAGQGADVVVSDLDLDAARRVADDVHRRWGVRTAAVAADVTDPDAVRTLVDEGETALDGIDIWVNNAGTAGQMDFAAAPDEAIGSVLAISLHSAVLCSRAVLDRMLPRARGVIVNVSSEASKSRVDHQTVYATAKAGVNRFTNALAREVGPRGVRVVAVSPGIMVSRPVADAVRGAGTDQDTSGMGAAFLAAIHDGLGGLGLGRVSIPEEVANVVAFLASDAAAYVHGVTVSVSGAQSDF